MISASMLESGETAWAVSPFLIGIGDRRTGLQVVRETGGQGCRWWGRQEDRVTGGGGDSSCVQLAAALGFHHSPSRTITFKMVRSFLAHAKRATSAGPRASRSL